MNQQEAERLIEKYVNGTATAREKQLVENWYASTAENKKLSDDDDFEHISAEVWANTLKRANLPHPQRVVRLWPRIAAAASILIFLSIGGYFYFSRRPVQQIAKNKPKQSDVLPGGNKAVLTLADGTKISLTDAKNGYLAKESNTRIDKTADGQVTYQGKTANNEVLYDMMTTPRGGQYTLVLADGTKVTLNAASSLKFPTAFTGSSRTVELTGEAYFEVAHDASKPFRVNSNGQTVEVLGTHFDIDSYQDDGLIKTTLLEGSVKIVAENSKALLKPGQQSQIDMKAAEHNIKVSNVDVDDEVAWKNGLFQFKNTGIKQVMNSAARWYDLDVTYEGKTPDLKITGQISRKVNLSGLISLLRFEGAKFNVEGRNVTVINK